MVTDLRTALKQACKTWLISMPVAACQLVLLTAAEDKVLIGSDLFASALPLAASGAHLCTVACRGDLNSGFVMRIVNPVLEVVPVRQRAPLQFINKVNQPLLGERQASARTKAACFHPSSCI